MLFTLLPDFDFIVHRLFPIGDSGLYHRVFFHNIFTFALFAFFIFLLNKRLKGKYFLTSNFVFFYSLHILLDLFDNGVPLFYPFSDTFFLIYQIGAYIDFPLKLVYEGNIHFSLFAILLYILSLSFFIAYPRWINKK